MVFKAHWKSEGLEAATKLALLYPPAPSLAKRCRGKGISTMGPPSYLALGLAILLPAGTALAQTTASQVPVTGGKLIYLEQQAHTTLYPPAGGFYPNGGILNQITGPSRTRKHSKSSPGSQRPGR